MSHFEVGADIAFFLEFNDDHCIQCQMKKAIAALTIVVVSVFVLVVYARPDQVPTDAWPRFSLKNGIVWYWDREVPGGCVSWMAMERWASVRVIVGTKCGYRGSEKYRDAKGLLYSSTEDESTFYGYWAWPLGTSSDYYVYDDEGNRISTEQCPHSLTERQVARIGEVVESAKSLSKTEEELAMLARLGVRLIMLNKASLSVSQFGCSDRPTDPQLESELGDVNAWTSK